MNARRSVPGQGIARTVRSERQGEGTNLLRPEVVINPIVLAQPHPQRGLVVGPISQSRRGFLLGEGRGLQSDGHQRSPWPGPLLLPLSRSCCFFPSFFPARVTEESGGRPGCCFLASRERWLLLLRPQPPQGPGDCNTYGPWKEMCVSEEDASFVSSSFSLPLIFLKPGSQTFRLMQRLQQDRFF